MRKITYILLIMGLFLSCSDDDKEKGNELAYLSISKNSVNFEAKGSDERIVVKTNVSGWKVQIPVEADWCSATPVTTSTNEEYNLIVFAKENTGKDVRSTTILLVADGAESQKIDVSQLGHGAAIILDKEEESVSIEETYVDLEVTTNIDYEIIIPEADKEWIEIVDPATRSSALGAKEIGLDVVTFLVKKNRIESERSSTIQLIEKDVTDGVKAEFKITQEKFTKVFSIDKTSAAVNALGEELVINVEANIDYEIIIPDVDKGWLEIVKTVAESPEVDIITLLVKENRVEIGRSSIVQFVEKDVTDGKKMELAITQEKFTKIFEVDKTSVTVDAFGSKLIISVKTNIDYELDNTSLPIWITLESKNENVFTFTIEEVGQANMYEGRTAQILFTELGDGASKTATTSVVQDPMIKEEVFTGHYRISGFQGTEIFNSFVTTAVSEKLAYNQFRVNGGYRLVSLKPVVTIADDLKISISQLTFGTLTDSGSDSYFDPYTKTFIVKGTLAGTINMPGIVDQRWSLYTNPTNWVSGTLTLTGAMAGADTKFLLVNERVKLYTYANKVGSKKCDIGLAINKDNSITVYSAGDAVKAIRNNTSTYDPATKTYTLKFTADLDATSVTEHTVDMTIKEP